MDILSVVVTPDALYPKVTEDFDRLLSLCRELKDLWRAAPVDAIDHSDPEIQALEQELAGVTDKICAFVEFYDG